MPLTFSAIFLGNSTTLIDPTEGNTNAENASALVGLTFGSISSPLTARLVDFTSVNVGGTSTVLEQNNLIANDQAQIFNGTTTVTRTFDAGANYRGQVTYVDGSQSALNITLSIVQMTNGDLYLIPAISGTTNTVLTAEPIRSIRLDGLLTSSFQGMTTDRPDLNFLTCFTNGTMLATPDGAVPVEKVKPGDRLMTADHGPQVVRWVGMRRVSPAQMTANPRQRPVLIRAGALGEGIPARDLMVSPQHRILLRSAIVARMTDQPEALVAARHLVGCPGIESVLPDAPVDYWHVLFDRHEVVLAEGCEAESLYLGTEAVKAMPRAALAEIAHATPDSICPLTGLGIVPGARPFVTGKQARRLVERHLSNRKPLTTAPAWRKLGANVVKLKARRAA